MATILTSSQQTFVDITDQRKLSAYITSNLPKTQSEDPNVLPHTYAPSWDSTNLVLTPVLFLDQTNVSPTATGVTIAWKRKDGVASETALTSGETVKSGVLTVNQNKLASSSSGMITYICYISYYDSETKNTINITADITYTLVKNAANAKLCTVSSDTYVFKYDTSQALVGASQAALTAQVQGVTISKWQYKNSSGAWTDYPTTSDNTSITGGTLVVKPAHSIFVSNVAQIRVTTSESDVFDTVTITKIDDGAKGDKGNPGSAGTGGLSVVLGNETQTIACTSAGKTSAASTITIPFTGYVGITQSACTCAVGTLPTGITVKTNTAATSSAAGKLELSVAASSNLGADATLTGNIMLTFTISGKPVTKVFTWTKSKAGSSGASAVVFSVYAPNGTIVQNQSGSILLATSAYAGSTAITSATYQWAKYSSGSWTNISGETSETLTVSGSDIINIQSYRCTMTYGGKNYVDVITVEDKSDPYVSEMLSIGGYTVKNNLGGVVPYVIVRTNQKEVDSLLGSISETAPSAPKSGDFWYKIDHTEKNFKLGSYSNTTSSSASSISYAIPVSWCNAVTDDIIGAASITGQVLFGGKVYKKFTANLTVSVPDTVIPSISSVTFSDVDDSAVPSSWGIYVQGQSGLKLKSISCTGAYGSEIKKVKMTADSRIRTTDYPELPEMDHISQSGEVSVMVTVTDSRNRTVNKSAVVSVVSYASPKLSSVKSERCNASGETDNDGTYFLSTTSAVFPSCLGKNALTLTVKYKRTDLKNYGNEVQINPGSNVCANNDLDPEYSCDVLYTLSDEFNTVTYSDFVSTAVYLMHFLHGGRTTSRSCS